MRRAMFEAEVGDDVYHEDPTVNRLEELAARMVGKEAAVFVPSGTMGNQMALRVHTQPGQELIIEDRSHVVLYEMGGSGVHSGLVTRTVPTDDGLLSWDLVKRRLRKPTDHNSGSGLVVVENTHNMAGGRVYPPEVLQEICGGAHAAGIPVHMDGARIFNAAAFLNCPVSTLTAGVDSVMFCLSKGLGAPVGSLLAGTREFVEKARLVRKLLGGGMRQAGILAAAGIVALEKSPAGLPADHANARLLADALAAMPGVRIDPSCVETNILVFDIAETGFNTAEFSAQLRGRGVLANGIDAVRMRMVTHYDVTSEDCEQAVRAMEEILTTARATA
jgi:threonine aldolase